MLSSAPLKLVPQGALLDSVLLRSVRCVFRKLLEVCRLGCFARVATTFAILSVAPGCAATRSAGTFPCPSGFVGEPFALLRMIPIPEIQVELSACSLYILYIVVTCAHWCVALSGDACFDASLVAPPDAPLHSDTSSHHSDSFSPPTTFMLLHLVLEHIGALPTIAGAQTAFMFCRCLIPATAARFRHRSQRLGAEKDRARFRARAGWSVKPFRRALSAGGACVVRSLSLCTSCLPFRPCACLSGVVMGQSAAIRPQPLALNISPKLPDPAGDRANSLESGDTDAH